MGGIAKWRKTNKQKIDDIFNTQNGIFSYVSGANIRK